MVSSQRRVVITGVGLISPLGSSKEELWEALSTGRSGVGPWTAFPLGDLPVNAAGDARQFQGRIEDFGPLNKEQSKAIRKGLKVMCRECQMGVAAAQRALADAGLDSGRADPVRSGVSFGSDHMVSPPEDFTEGILECINEAGQFDFAQWPGSGLPKMFPLWLLKYLPNMPASHLAIYNDLEGPSNSITMREASPGLAVADAFQVILRGAADVMLVGATGTRIHPWKTIHAVQQEEVAQPNGDPTKASRPFDLNRTGMVLGEGAGAVILEDLDSAVRRGVPIYGEVLGCASNASLGRKLVARREVSMTNTLRGALAQSGLSADQIGHVHAHGLSTRRCDSEEAQAIQAVFGDRAQPVPVVAAKSYFGNLGAGGGMVELIASLLSLRQGRLFATLNHETRCPDCPVNVVVDSGTPPGGSFVNLNVTPQGQASAVVIRAV